MRRHNIFRTMFITCSVDKSNEIDERGEAQHGTEMYNQKIHLFTQMSRHVKCIERECEQALINERAWSNLISSKLRWIRAQDTHANILRTH